MNATIALYCFVAFTCLCGLIAILVLPVGYVAFGAIEIIKGAEEPADTSDPWGFIGGIGYACWAATVVLTGYGLEYARVQISDDFGGFMMFFAVLPAYFLTVLIFKCAARAFRPGIKFKTWWKTSIETTGQTKRLTWVEKALN